MRIEPVSPKFLRRHINATTHQTEHDNHRLHHLLSEGFFGFILCGCCIDANTCVVGVTGTDVWTLYFGYSPILIRAGEPQLGVPLGSPFVWLPGKPGPTRSDASDPVYETRV